MKYLIILMMLGACASTPRIEVKPKTLLGHTVTEARLFMTLNPDPNDISISECHLESGEMVPVLNQLRLRLQNDYNKRQGKKFMNTYNHRVLYPINAFSKGQ